MARKTLGIIGKGGSVANFCAFLQENEKHAEEFFEQFHRILFYNQGYATEEAFRKSGKFPEISGSLENLLSRYGLKGPVPEEKKPIPVEKDFEQFFTQAEVIVDASGIRPPERILNAPRGNYRQIKGKLFCDRKERLFQENDWTNYEKECLDQGKVPKEHDQFKEEWNLAIDCLEIIEEVNQKMPLGIRSLAATPFHLPLLLQRGQEISRIINDKAISRRIPTYVNLINELCLTSTILAGTCPELTAHLVGLGGFDLERLKDDFSQEYSINKADANSLSIGISGAHDTHLMIPVIYPLSGESKDLETFDHIFSRVDYRKAYHYLKKKLGNYYARHPDENFTSRQVSRSLLETVITAAKSQGKELTYFPGRKESPLCNGYFQPRAIDDSGKGIFLFGNHRFCNGEVVPVPMQVGNDQIKELISKEENEVLFKFKTLLDLLSVRLEGQVQFPVIVERKPAEEAPLYVNSKPASLYVLARDRKKIQGRRATRVWELSSAEGDATKALSLPDYRYTSLTGFTGKNNRYLALAFNNKKRTPDGCGVLIYNLDADGSGERKTACLKMGQALEDDFSGLEVIKNGVRARDQTLWLAHRQMGIITISLEDFLEKELLKVEPHLAQNQVLPPAPGGKAAPLIKVSGDKIYVAKGREVYLAGRDGKLQEKPIFSVEAIITALEEESGRLYVGTNRGEILHEGKPYQTFKRSPRVLQLVAGERKKERGVYVLLEGGNSGSGGVYFATPQEVIPLSKLGEDVLQMATFGPTLYLLEESKLVALKGEEKKTLFILENDFARRMHMQGGI